MIRSNNHILSAIMCLHICVQLGTCTPHESYRFYGNSATPQQNRYSGSRYSYVHRTGNYNAYRSYRASGPGYRAPSYGRKKDNYERAMDTFNALGGNRSIIGNLFYLPAYWRYAPRSQPDYENLLGYYGTYYQKYFNYRPPGGAFMNRGNLGQAKIICENFELNNNGTFIGVFSCPLEFEPSSHSFCCGEYGAQYCCKILDVPMYRRALIFGCILVLCIVIGGVACLIRHYQISAERRKEQKPWMKPVDPEPLTIEEKNEIRKAKAKGAKTVYNIFSNIKVGVEDTQAVNIDQSRRNSSVGPVKKKSMFVYYDNTSDEDQEEEDSEDQGAVTKIRIPVREGNKIRWGALTTRNAGVIKHVTKVMAVNTRRKSRQIEKQEIEPNKCTSIFKADPDVATGPRSTQGPFISSSEKHIPNPAPLIRAVHVRTESYAIDLEGCSSSEKVRKRKTGPKRKRGEKRKRQKTNKQFSEC